MYLFVLIGLLVFCLWLFLSLFDMKKDAKRLKDECGRLERREKWLKNKYKHKDIEEL